MCVVAIQMSCATLYPGLYGGVFCDDDADIIASQAWQITMARAFVPHITHTPKSVTCLRAVAHTEGGQDNALVEDDNWETRAPGFVLSLLSEQGESI